MDSRNTPIFLWKKMENHKKYIYNFRRTWYNIREGKASKTKNKARKHVFGFRHFVFRIALRVTRAKKIGDFLGFAVIFAKQTLLQKLRKEEDYE